jgi:hypothetical protein
MLNCLCRRVLFKRFGGRGSAYGASPKNGFYIDYQLFISNEKTKIQVYTAVWIVIFTFAGLKN